MSAVAVVAIRANPRMLGGPFAAYAYDADSGKIMAQVTGCQSAAAANAHADEYARHYGGVVICNAFPAVAVQS